MLKFSGHFGPLRAYFNGYFTVTLKLGKRRIGNGISRSDRTAQHATCLKRTEALKENCIKVKCSLKAYIDNELKSYLLLPNARSWVKHRHHKATESVHI